MRIKVNPTGGFSLIELLVVVTILSILAAFVIPKIFDRPDQARVTKARMDIKALESALMLYKLDNGDFPSTQQGLMALVQKPSSGDIPKKWNPEGYLKKVPKDPWGNEYVYLSPGLHDKYDLVCLGADGDIGGEGYKADINSWEMD